MGVTWKNMLNFICFPLVSNSFIVHLKLTKASPIKNNQISLPRPVSYLYKSV